MSAESFGSPTEANRLLVILFPFITCLTLLLSITYAVRIQVHVVHVTYRRPVPFHNVPNAAYDHLSIKFRFQFVGRGKDARRAGIYSLTFYLLLPFRT